MRLKGMMRLGHGASEAVFRAEGGEGKGRVPALEEHQRDKVLLVIVRRHTICGDSHQAHDIALARDIARHPGGSRGY